MAYNRKQNQKPQEQKKREPLKVTDCRVIRAHRFQDGAETCDVILNGLTIYGCRIVEGKNGTFISFPSRKGTDGNYYSHVYAVLDDKTIEDICNQTEALLNQ